MPSTADDVTALLARWSEGDRQAEEELFRLVRGELRRIARRYASRSAGATLQTTAVVNEAYLRLASRQGAGFRDRAHFFAFSARAMRHAVVDHARAKAYAKRGGGARPEPLDEERVFAPERPADVLALDEALEALTAETPRPGRVVELRYFGGLTTGEIASVLEVSPATVERDWRFARAWLYERLAGGWAR
jgi:RNA polymerase sigma factor (TIGR02999 family)